MKLVLLLCIPPALFAQKDSGLQQGRALFRSNCAFCHGMTATGGRGPNLVSAPLSHGGTDDSIKRVIRIGVPGTTMPAFSDLTPEEISNIVEYLRSLSRGSSRQQHVAGDAKLGKDFYDYNGCAGCHRIEGQGSIFGPDLSRIGASRSVEYIRESIVNPSGDIPEAYEGVTVVSSDGKATRGIRINEDTFTIQLRDQAQKIHMFAKNELSRITHEKSSLMPTYKPPDADLQNLVAYLVTLRGSTGSTAVPKKATGIK